MSTIKKLKKFFIKLQLWFKDRYFLVFKSAAENHLRIQHIRKGITKAMGTDEDLVSDGEVELAPVGCGFNFNSYTQLKEYQKKFRIMAFSSTSTAVFMISVAMIF